MNNFVASAICFFICSLCFFIVGLFNFTDNFTHSLLFFFIAVLNLATGILQIVNGKKDKKKKEDLH